MPKDINNFYKPYDPEKPVISIHVPKTAGQSFRLVLESWYKENLFLHYPEVSIYPLKFSELKSGQCVHGHFSKTKGYGINKYITDCSDDSANFITIIRNPYKIIVSLFLYLKYNSKALTKNRPKDFKTFFNHFIKHNHPLFNLILDFKYTDIDTYIKKYTFIGTQELYDKSISLLADRLGFPEIKPKKVNISDYNNDKIPDLENIAREYFTNEYLLYDRINEIIASITPDLNKMKSNFQRNKQQNKISIITPSYNSNSTIEKAIQSVLNQGYPDFEHIIVDGGSTDTTLDLIKKYPHLKWVSEQDRGQVHAMNKGFDMSTGDIIGYLNADDYYLENAFSSVIPYFKDGTDMVMGKIKVITEKAKENQNWICDPKTDFSSMLRHWEMNAFCVNPVGYFYRREVQERIPLREESTTKHDLEFLLNTSLHFKIHKIDKILGIFNHNMDTQTGNEQLLPSYWQPNNFPFIEKLATNLSEKDQKQFFLDRDRGYQLRRHQTAKEAFARGIAKELLDTGEVIMLPEDENDCRPSRCGFVDRDRIATKGDWIIPVMTMGKVASTSICQALKLLPKNILPAETYHIHQMGNEQIYKKLAERLPHSSHQAVGLSLFSIFKKYGQNYIYKFITCIREPVECGLSAIFEVNFGRADNMDSAISNILYYNTNYFDQQYNTVPGINVYDHPFDHNKGYCIIKKDNIELLILRFEDLDNIFSQAIKDFLGIENVSLSKYNVSSLKDYASEYKKFKNNVVIQKDKLDETYKTKMVQHFYTPEEITTFYNKWSKNESAENSRKIQGIIYDIGMHSGQDTEFYLKKGFKVIAVDANPEMCKKVKEKLGAFISSKQLKILNVGIVENPTDKELDFYVNNKISEWSSFIKDIAARDNHPCHTVKVPCMTLNQILEKYGSPYYVKIDIEGHDLIALKSLLSSNSNLPKYISVENGNSGMAKMLLSKGYDKFKYVQQNNIQNICLPNPARESFYIPHSFPFGASGPFGEETPGEWKSYDEILIDIKKVWDPESTTKNPEHDDAVHGWFDLHAKQSKA